MEKLSRRHYKDKLRYFWTKYWVYGKTPEEWIDLIDNPHSGAKHLRIMEIALHKLERERKILSQQRIQMWDMLKSPDKENHLVVLSIMNGLKPKKFKKIIK